MRKYRVLLTVFLQGVVMVAQESAIKAHWSEGVLIAGYAGKGAFLNFSGPHLSYTSGNSRITVGMLPSLRFKKDHSAVKNTWVTPNLGMGITYTCRNIAVQVPFYYNSKTASVNGKWIAGIGFGMKLQ